MLELLAGDAPSADNTAVPKSIIAQYQTQRVRSFWPSYSRILQLTEESLISIDPNTFAVKKVFLYSDISNLEADAQSADLINIEHNGKVYIFKTEFRTQLLVHLFACVFKIKQKSLTRDKLTCKRIRKNGERVNCLLIVEPYGIIELTSSEQVLQEYLFSNLSLIGVDQRSMCFYFEYSNRLKVFFADDVDSVVSKLVTKIKRLGLASKLPISTERNIGDIITTRSNTYRSIGVALTFFDVNKRSARKLRSSSRKLFIGELHLIEKDSAGFELVSVCSLSSIYCLRRSWDDPREFSIEYEDGSCRVYTCTTRDTLLATLVDATHAAGNTRVSVTSFSFDTTRLLPRNAPRSCQSSLTYSLFTAASIERWFLSALAKQRKGDNSAALISACKDFVSNVSCPGLSASTDLSVVHTCVFGILAHLDRLLPMKSDRRSSLAELSILLQALYRLIPCRAGFKAVVNVSKCDARAVFLKLLHVDDDLVHYWTIETLLVLVRCPLNPRDLQQEFVNKHALLSEEVLASLVDLMGIRLPLPADAMLEDTESLLTDDSSTFHTPSKSNPPLGSDADNSTLDAGKSFVPNSLVIITASALLESVLSSNKDSTSPELAERLLDMLAQSSDTLMHMLKSSSSLIVENAAVLIHVLIRKREQIGEALRESALVEGLILKHFAMACFASSANQRFVSRFLVSMWMCGEGEGKSLLKRILPAGLLEYLKFSPVSDEHSLNLDQLEHDHFASCSNSKVDYGSPTVVSPRRSKLRERVSISLSSESTALPSELADEASAFFHNCEPSREVLQQDFENFRIMFHAITQNHHLPDLLWNEQTRLELQEALDVELVELEKEQRRHVGKKVAWNYAQFCVRYDSLKDEPKVGLMYLQPFLEAGRSFVASIANPAVLFEMLLRRVLVNIAENISLAVLCAKCLCKLYRACSDSLGAFDDMLLLVGMMDKSNSFELQHYLLELIEVMSANPSNLLELVDRDTVNSMLRFASLSHLNPDQIGNILARLATNTLLLKFSESDVKNEDKFESPCGKYSVDSSTLSKVKSAWIPEDDSCPKIWYMSPPGSDLPPPSHTVLGPFRVADILYLLERSEITDSWLVAPSSAEDYFDDQYESVVDTGLWKELRSYFQLHVQLLLSGDPILSPSEVASKAIGILCKIGAVHQAASKSGIEFYPLPISKRIMSDPTQLSIIAKLLLSNDSAVVEQSAVLLHSLVQCNLIACSKLYLTGAFYFGCRYTGNNFLEIARLFHVSHLKQSHEVSSAQLFKDLPLEHQSILGSMLPGAMVRALVNYSPNVFATIFTGFTDSPEFIWNPELRQYLVQMLDQHIGVFMATLRQYTLASYEFIPMPKVHYPALERELYVYEYYLKNLCDEARFPDWPISSPLDLLRETIDRWRQEMEKGIVDTAVSEAKKVLHLEDGFTNATLRTAYRSLARVYHPDKNPNGREIFESIKSAYEMLCSIEMSVAETNMTNVLLLIRSQNIVFRRFPDIVSDQQYPSYDLLIKVLEVPTLNSEQVDDSLDSELLEEALKLVYFTCSVNSQNTEELVEFGGLTVLFKVLSYCISCVLMNGSSSRVTVYFECCMKTFSLVSQLEVGKEHIINLCPEFAVDITRVVDLSKQFPLIANLALEVVANCSSCTELQSSFLSTGIVWKLIPLALVYDFTVAAESNPYLADLSLDNTTPTRHSELHPLYTSDHSSSGYSQATANLLAVSALRALGRLGGYMLGDLATPTNEYATTALSKLLTAPLAKLLRYKNPKDLLLALNENVEKCSKFWNVGMRNELLEFVNRIDSERGSGVRNDDLAPASSFHFSALKDEIMIGGVYIRIFVKQAEISDVEDPYKFCRDLLQFVSNALAGVREDDGSSFTSILESLPGAVIDALKVLASSNLFIAEELIRMESSVSTVFRLLDVRFPSEILEPTVLLFRRLCLNSDFVSTSARQYPNCAQTLIRFLCLGTGQVAAEAWLAVESFVSNFDGSDVFLQFDGTLYLLGIIFGSLGYCHLHTHRLKAVALLSKLMLNPVKGSEAATSLRRFIPEPLVRLLKGRAAEATLKVFDSVSETPELFWTLKMREEARSAVRELLHFDGDSHAGFLRRLALPPSYSIFYAELADEIYIGGVYIRLYLKQRTYRLQNPVFFLEQLLVVWESAFNSQVPQSSAANGDYNSSHSELILGKEDFLGMLTSCIICVMSTEDGISDHLFSWGLDHRLFSLMATALSTDKRGVPLVSALRLVKELVSVRGSHINNTVANAETSIIFTLMNALKASNDPSSLEVHKDAVLTAEILKIIFQHAMYPTLDALVNDAITAKLPEFILDNILAAELTHVRNYSALRINAVETLKAMCECDEYADLLISLLSSRKIWNKYRSQSQDLFISAKDKVDPYLVEDSHDKKFAALLTDMDPSAAQKHTFVSTTQSPPQSAQKPPISSSDSQDDYQPPICSFDSQEDIDLEALVNPFLDEDDDDSL